MSLLWCIPQSAVVNELHNVMLSYRVALLLIVSLVVRLAVGSSPASHLRSAALSDYIGIAPSSQVVPWS